MKKTRYKIPDYPRERPQVPGVLRLVRAYFQKPGNGAGGVLHVVLDDGNLELSHLEWTRNEAVAKGDKDAIVIVDKLARMTRTQRLKVHHQVYR